MPPANKKLQQQQLTLSKHVKKAWMSSTVTESSKSGIPRASRATVVLTDEMLLEIKKGLETVGSKVRVKRLHSAKQSAKMKSPPKKTPAKVGRRKNISQQAVDEEHSESSKQGLAKLSSHTKVGAVGKGKNAKSIQQDSPSEQLNELYLKTPDMTKGKHSKLNVKEKTSSSKPSPQSVKSTGKKTTPKSSQSSPYYLRSKPEMPALELSAGSPKTVHKAKKRSMSPENLFAVPMAVNLTATKATSARKVGRPRKSESSDSLPVNKIRYSLSASEEAVMYTKIKSAKTTDSSRKIIHTGSDVEKSETPLKALKKRKSEVFNDEKLEPKAKKRSSTGMLSSQNVFMVNDVGDMQPSVRLSMINIGNSSLNNSSKGVSGSNLKAPDSLPFDSLDCRISSVSQSATANELQDVNFRQKAFDDDLLSSSRNISNSSVKCNSSVRWDTSAVKTRLIESINPNRKLTRYSYYSETVDDSTDFGVLNAVKREPVSLSNTPVGRSILKRGSAGADNDTPNLHSDNEKAIKCKVPSRRRRICCNLLQYLMLLGLPVAVAMAAYAYILK